MHPIAQWTLATFSIFAAMTSGFGVLTHKHHGAGDLIFITALLGCFTGATLLLGLTRLARIARDRAAREADRLIYRKVPTPKGQQPGSWNPTFDTTTYPRTQASIDFKQLRLVLNLSVRECALALKVPDVVVFGLVQGRYSFDMDVARWLMVKFADARWKANLQTIPDFSSEGRLVSELTEEEKEQMSRESESEQAKLDAMGGWHGDGIPTRCGMFPGYAEAQDNMTAGREALAREIREPGKVEIPKRERKHTMHGLGPVKAEGEGEPNHERFAREGKYD
jgi:hypothetical protein